MHDRRLNDRLKRIHEPDVTNRPRPQHRRELEGRLLSRYRTNQSRKRRWLVMLNPWNRTARFAVVGLALTILGVGACTTSTTTEVDMGKKMTIGFTAKADADMISVDTSLGNFLDAQPGIENVSVSISRTMDGPATIEVMAWGQDLDGEALAAEMRRQIPELQDADIAFETLSGTIEESYASKLKREIFQMEVDGATEEEIRAQILAQLAEQGVAEGDAQVEVIQQDGQTEIKVQVTKEVEE
ncbi:MAG: hypothetical protein ABFS42_14035 [Candidatus Krumholzibacteriota bacterium]